MITKFKKGDLVPKWVIRATIPELQKEASFGVDVNVEHGPNNSGPVTVSPAKILKVDEDLCRISKIGNTCGWIGSPTLWSLEVIQ